MPSSSSQNGTEPHNPAGVLDHTAHISDFASLLMYGGFVMTEGFADGNVRSWDSWATCDVLAGPIFLELYWSVGGGVLQLEAVTFCNGVPECLWCPKYGVFSSNLVQAQAE